MAVEKPYFILGLDVFEYREDKSETYGGYKKSKVFSSLNKALKLGEFEKACTLGIELDISCYTIILWKKLLYFITKEINIANPQLPLYLWKRVSYLHRFNKKLNTEKTTTKYITKKQLKQPIRLFLCNYQELRNRLIECITIISFSDKKKITPIPKITSKDFSLETLKLKLRAKKKGHLLVWRPQDPPEFVLPITEFVEILFSKDRIHNRIELLSYWLGWLFEWEKRFVKKTGSIFKCAERKQKGVHKKYHRDFVWMLWEIIFKKMKKDTKYISPNKIKQVCCLYNLFCFDYDKSGKKQRLSIIIWAIHYLIPKTPDISMNKPICAHTSLVVKMCGSVNAYYKKIEKNTKKYTSKANTKIAKSKRLAFASSEFIKAPCKTEKTYSKLQSKKRDISSYKPKISKRRNSKRQNLEEQRVNDIIKRKEQVSMQKKLAIARTLELDRQLQQKEAERKMSSYIYYTNY